MTTIARLAKANRLLNIGTGLRMSMLLTIIVLISPSLVGCYRRTDQMAKCHAMVIQDPDDKQKVKGFCHLLLVRPNSLSVTGGRGDGSSVWDDTKISIARVAEAMNQYTDVRTEVIGHITFDDKELFRAPWVLTPIPDARIRTSRSEAKNMGRYLRSGGFHFLENAWGAPGLIPGFEKVTREVARKIMKSVGLTEGRTWAFERLPQNHTIYHCYFDFDGPPAGEDMHWLRSKNDTPAFDYLEGITIDRRLWILLSQKGYSIGIHDFWPDGPNPHPEEAMRMLRFCVNTIIFALTQDGSLTQRLMDSAS